jgi:Ca2+-transporting ATPase
VEIEIGQFLLNLGSLLAITYLLAGVLERIRIPGILAALFVGMLAHYGPTGDPLLSLPLRIPFSYLAQLGVLFLLFFIGLQIDPKEMRRSSSDIIWCTVLNTSVPFLFGVTVMLALGYGWILAFVIGLTRMPTAEAVIVPILDEFKLIRTRIGTLIVGVGTLDDVIEVFLVALVSVWIGKKAGALSGGLASSIFSVLLSISILLLVAWTSYRWLIPWLARWLPPRTHYLMMLSVVILFAFGGYTEFSHLGIIVGAVIAGVLMRPTFDRMNVAGKEAIQSLRSISYGFLGLVFFFWVGLSVDLEGMLQSPMLTVLLYLAGTIGKLLGVFLMVPMKKLTLREAWIVGVGLDARLTTEIIVAKLLLDAGLINTELFTALVAAASFTAITVPLAFTLLVSLWGDEMRGPKGGSNKRRPQRHPVSSQHLYSRLTGNESSQPR